MMTVIIISRIIVHVVVVFQYRRIYSSPAERNGVIQRSFRGLILYYCMTRMSQTCARPTMIISGAQLFLSYVKPYRNVSANVIEKRHYAYNQLQGHVGSLVQPVRLRYDRRKNFKRA